MSSYTQTQTKVVESSLSHDALVQGTTEASLQNEITKSIFTFDTFLCGVLLGTFIAITQWLKMFIKMIEPIPSPNEPLF